MAFDQLLENELKKFESCIATFRKTPPPGFGKLLVDQERQEIEEMRTHRQERERAGAFAARLSG